MNNTLTLWQLLSQQEIVVPMIQRDYAQGRSGKEHIRSAFLKDVETHLIAGTSLTLDFVYGNTESGKFHPLDGQQRLNPLRNSKISTHISSPQLVTTLVIIAGRKAFFVAPTSMPKWMRSSKENLL